jgi:hypothetical protein
MSEIARVQRGALTQSIAGKAALKVYGAETTEKIAERIRDPEMLEAALVAKLTGQRDFAGEYVSKFPDGGDRHSQEFQNASSGALKSEDWCKLYGFALRTVQRWLVLIKPDEFEIRRAAITKRCWELCELWLKDSQLVQQSLSNEHYTPKKYIEAARVVLGEIDLDPASCEEANQIVKAKKFFSIEDDGLEQEWYGNVWLNPPYGGLGGKFIEKLCASYKEGKVTAAITLVNAHCTDTIWFQSLWDGCLCFTDHRINFVSDGTRSGSTHGSVFAYFGSEQDKFIETFTDFGRCVLDASVVRATQPAFGEGATSENKQDRKRRLSPHPAGRARRHLRRPIGRPTRFIPFARLLRNR